MLRFSLYCSQMFSSSETSVIHMADAHFRVVRCVKAELSTEWEAGENACVREVEGSLVLEA